MRTAPTLVLLVPLAALLSGCGGATPSGPAAPPAGAPSPPLEVGLAVGSQAPEFTLKDQTGRDRSLAELRKAGLVAVVFYRSARW
jgi:hypothetical protein